MRDDHLALFLLLGRTVAKVVRETPALPSSEQLILAPGYDIAPALPEISRRASQASEVYRLFFVFENYLRELVLDVLNKAAVTKGNTWWDLVPADVQTDVTKLEATEDAKAWMAL